MVLHLCTITDWKELWQNGALMLYQVSSDGPSLDISLSLRVEPDLSYTLSCHGNVVDSQKCGILSNIPSCVTSGKIMYRYGCV